MLKVLHIATNDKGGAANSAVRLHKGLHKLGVQSKILVLRKATTTVDDVIKFSPVNPPSIPQRILHRLGWPQTYSQKNYTQLKSLKGVYEVFAFPRSDYNIVEHPLYKEADIINLHWVVDFIDYPSFFKEVTKPIVWTFHDMNAILGGFCYANDEKNNPAFAELNREVFNIKKNVLKNIKERELTIVAPSKWLTNLVADSEIFGRFPLHRIPYGLDTDVFCETNHSEAKKFFQFDESKRAVLFVCDYFQHSRKGFDLFCKMHEAFVNDEQFLFVAVGKIPEYFKELPNMRLISRIDDEKSMSLLFNAADIYVLPSREDNLPNVMLESICCGTPVVGFEIGGLPDVIREGFNGSLSASVSAEGLKESFLKVVENYNSFDRTAISRSAINDYNLQRQAKNYQLLYSDCLDRFKAYNRPVQIV